MQAMIELANKIAVAEAQAETAKRRMRARAYLRRAQRIGARVCLGIGCAAVLAGWFLLWLWIGTSI